MRPFDTRSLQREPTPEQIAELRARERAGAFGPPGAPRWLAIIFIAIFVAVFGGASVTIITVAVAVQSQVGNFQPSGPFGVSPMVIVGAVGVFFLLVPALIIRAMVRGRAREKDWLRIALFARDNGLGFLRRSANPIYPGLLFGIGHDRIALDHVWSGTGVLADAGRYQYSVGSGEDESTYTWSYVVYRLPSPLPHLVLDSTGNNRAGGLPVSYTRDQRVSLGQPFDSRFTLYAPAGYGRDAFYLLPPDLMQDLIDAPVDYDIEIVDDWLFLYSRNIVDFAAPATWATIDRVGSTVVARMSQLAQRYRDDRAGLGQPAVAAASGFAASPGRPVPAIADQGRRLRTNRWAGVVVLIIFAIVAIAIQWWFRTAFMPH